MSPRKVKALDSRFNGPLRHYHRSNVRPEKSWEEWTEGKAPAGKQGFKLWLVILTILGMAALIAIIVGLFVEMQ